MGSFYIIVSYYSAKSLAQVSTPLTAVGKKCHTMKFITCITLRMDEASTSNYN